MAVPALLIACAPLAYNGYAMDFRGSLAVAGCKANPMRFSDSAELAKLRAGVTFAAWVKYTLQSAGSRQIEFAVRPPCAPPR